MPSDEQIFVAGTASAPLDYTVANSVELVPLAVRAVFNGSGASGSFVPTVEIISDGGVTVATCPALTEVSAGASALCTFAPGFEGVSAAAVSYALTSVDVSVAATAVVIPAVASHRIQVRSVGLMGDGFTNLSFTSGGTLAGPFPLAPNTGFVLAPGPTGHYWFQSAAGTALTLTLSVAANVGGVITYQVV